MFRAATDGIILRATGISTCRWYVPGSKVPLQKISLLVITSGFLHGRRVTILTPPQNIVRALASDKSASNETSAGDPARTFSGASMLTFIDFTSTWGI